MPPPNTTLTAAQLVGCVVHLENYGHAYVVSAYGDEIKLHVIDGDFFEWCCAGSVRLLIPKSDLLTLADSIHQASQ